MPGVLPENVAFEAQAVTGSHTTRVYDAVSGYLARYVLTCTVDGQKAEPDGSVTIRLPAPEEVLHSAGLTVWHQATVTPRVENDCIVFETTII